MLSYSWSVDLNGESYTEPDHNHSTTTNKNSDKKQEQSDDHEGGKQAHSFFCVSYSEYRSKWKLEVSLWC